MEKEKIGFWFKTTIFNPDGTKERGWLGMGYGRTETEAYLNAKSSAEFTAAELDDVAHLPSGSHKIGKLERTRQPYGILIGVSEDGTTTIYKCETGEVKTWLPDSAAPLQ